MHLEHGRLLKFPADAEQSDFGFVELSQVAFAFEQGVAFVWPRLAGDDIHHRGLAGAIRPDDRAHLARLNGEREIVQRPEPVEGDRDAVEIKQGGCGSHFHCAYSAGFTAASATGSLPLAAARRACRSDHQWEMVPTMPRGRNRVTPTNNPPSRNSQ